MNKKFRILLIEDFPQTAQNIAYMIRKELLEHSSFSNYEIQIDVAFTIAQAAYHFARVSSTGQKYNAVVSDYIMLPKEGVKERLTKEAILIGRKSREEKSDAEIIRFSQILPEIRSLEQLTENPIELLNVLESQKDKREVYERILAEWHTGAIIRFIKYGYPNIPLLICTGTTFERELIAKTLGIKESDLESQFQIRFMDKAYLNQNPNEYREHLRIPEFIELIEYYENLPESNRVNTSDLTSHIDFTNFVFYIALQMTSEKEDDEGKRFE